MFGSVGLETTGLVNGLNKKHGEQTHEIIEISISLFDESFKVYDKFTSLVKPLHIETASEEAFLINKIRRKDLENAPSPMEIRRELFNWISQHAERVTVVGWNYDIFDRPFLTAFLGVDLYDKLFHYHTIDVKTLVFTLKTFLGFLPELEGTSLVDVAKFFQVPHLPHEAFADTYAVRKILEKILKMIQIK